jgi:hypothetical protein
MDPCPRAARVYDRSKIVFLGGYSRTNHASHATIMALHPCGCISECEGSCQGSLHIPVCANRLRFWAAAVVNDASWSKSSGTTKRASPIGGALSPYPRQRCVFSATTSSEIDAAFATIARDQADALFVALDAFFTSHRGQFATLAARDRLPTNCANRAMVEAGLLMSYGTSVADMFRQVRIYTGRILNGEKPADLPVLQSTKFEFVINLQTARALGIEVPNSIQLLADEVIE